MALPAVRPATIADIDALPVGMKGEIIDGVLYAMTRPRGVHQVTAARICADVVYSFDRGRGGPGGWWILPEPGIELPGSPEIAPDVAGWKRERMPTVPRNRSITVVPDWVCEVLSPTTRGYHFLHKRPYHARVGVRFLWEVDVDTRVISVARLEQGHWLDLGAWSDDEAVALPPFDAVPMEVRAWWIDASDES